MQYVNTRRLVLTLSALIVFAAALFGWIRRG